MADNLRVERFASAADGTLSRLLLGGLDFGAGIEPARAIVPAGTYKVGWHESPAFGGARKLHVLDVPGCKWILIHQGKHVGQTKGCLLIGSRFSADAFGRKMLDKSREWVRWLEAHPPATIEYAAMY